MKLSTVENFKVSMMNERPLVEWSKGDLRFHFWIVRPASATITTGDVMTIFANARDRSLRRKGTRRNPRAKAFAALIAEIVAKINAEGLIEKAAAAAQEKAEADLAASRKNQARRLRDAARRTFSKKVPNTTDWAMWMAVQSASDDAIIELAHVLNRA